MAIYEESEQYAQVMDKINMYLLYIFTFEIILKAFVYHKKLFKDTSNKFDAVIVLGSWIGLGLSTFSTLDIGNIAIIVRTFRISRIIRLL